MNNQLRIFISYSRADKEEVHRIESSLKTQGFDPWLDTKQLQGGQEWDEELQAAIDHCHVLLLCVSPEALQSDYVHAEWHYAHTIGKMIIPVMMRPVERMPLLLHRIQYVSYHDLPFEDAFEKLAAALEQIEPVEVVPHSSPEMAIPDVPEPDEMVTPQPPPPIPEPSLNDLWVAGAEAKAQGDLDRAARLWERLVRRAPNFQDGIAAAELKQLNIQLLPIRVDRLTALANEACQQGDWGREIGAWNEVLKLKPRDREAKKRLQLAQLHQNNAWLYANAVKLLEQNRPDGAKGQLELLYRNAPHYGDPFSIAESLDYGIRLDYYSSHMAAEDRKQKEQAAQTEYQRKIKDARERQKQEERERKQIVDRVMAEKRNQLAAKLRLSAAIDSEINALKKAATATRYGSIKTIVMGTFILPTVLLTVVAIAVTNGIGEWRLPSDMQGIAYSLACLLPLIWMALGLRGRGRRRSELLLDAEMKRSKKAELDKEIKLLRQQSNTPEPIDKELLTAAAQTVTTLAMNEGVRNFVLGFFKR